MSSIVIFIVSTEPCRDENGNPINEGQSVPPNDPCEATCYCLDGFIYCNRCPQPPPGSSECQPIYNSPGDCCPSWGHCFEPSECRDEEGYPINNGLDLPDRSPCEVDCFCHEAEITCAIIDCPFYDDCEPIYVEGQCCPSFAHCIIEP